MKAYIFRILAEEEEMFLREIALSENNTLLDFHDILADSIKADNKQLASFFVTNRQWEKQKEFTLVDMEVDDYTNDRIVESIPVGIMEDAYIGDIVEDSKQRLLYEYNFVNPTLFFISLIEEREAGEKERFPKVIASEGNVVIDDVKLFDDSFEAEMLTRGKGRESYDDLMDEEGFDDDDLRALGFEGGDGLYDDEYYGSDSYAEDDF